MSESAIGDSLAIAELLGAAMELEADGSAVSEPVEQAVNPIAATAASESAPTNLRLSVCMSISLPYDEKPRRIFPTLLVRAVMKHSERDEKRIEIS
jgi:hypothetical protein